MTQTILITGATSAIGGALALDYAKEGTTLILHGRDEQKLSEISKACEDKGAKTISKILDLTKIDDLQSWLEELGTHDTIDMVIVNAGMNIHIGPNGEAEPWDKVNTLLDLNLKASMAIAHGVLPQMRQRRSGQIVFVSSLAGYFGLPVTPTYSASKAGLKAYGEALRGWLQPEGIKVNVVMPGYVTSEMCDAMPGPKPFLWTPQRASKVIRKGLARDKARITFPFPLDFGTWLLAVMPASISIRILQFLGYDA